ncbi:MAG: hypothetical protein NXI31_25485 [bacterium]|nr:hypothetical protein [bacterium]
MLRSAGAAAVAFATAIPLFSTTLPGQCRPVRHFGFHQERVGASLAADGDQALFGHSNGFNCGHYSYLGDGFWRRSALMGGTGAGRVAMGRAVALRGDLALLGDPGDSTQGAGAGAGVIYERAAGSWSRNLDLYPPTANGGSYGSAVAISDDSQRLLVTAINDPAGGALHIYVRQSGNWVLEQTITGHSLTPSTGLGTATAMLQGRLFLSTGSNGTSEVRVLTQVGGTWTQTTALAPAQLPPNSGFGSRLDGDGNHLIVSAPLAPYAGSQKTGLLFDYDLSLPNWENRPAVISSPTWTATTAFGRAMDLSGDRLAIGAEDEAFVFQRSASGWRYLAWVVPPLTGFSAHFGDAVALFDHGLLVGDNYYDDDPWNYPDGPGAVHTYDLIDVGQPFQACWRGVAIQSGGNLRMRIDWPQHAGKNYQIFGSATGLGPTVVNGVAIPLTRDLYTDVLMLNPAFFQSGSGTLDANGRATPEWVVPPGLPLALAGVSFHHAVVAWDSNSLAATNPVTTQLISIY